MYGSMCLVAFIIQLLRSSTDSYNDKMQATFLSVLGCKADAAQPCPSNLTECVPADIGGVGRPSREWFSHEHPN